MLLLDEPFGALDALTRTAMQRWLEQMWRHHHWTALLITHDVREAVFLSDRIYVLSARPARIVATRRGYQFAVDHPEDAAALLIAANKDALTNLALIHASLKALIDGHYLRSQSGALGTMDPAKMEAIGDYLFASGIFARCRWQSSGATP
jgi:ABC-type proline/glycine betaine transport system ATPase subunit